LVEEVKRRAAFFAVQTQEIHYASAYHCAQDQTILNWIKELLEKPHFWQFFTLLDNKSVLKKLSV